MPRLLDPSIGKWSLKELTGVRVTGTESIDGRTCYRLEGVNEYQDKVTAWIDQRSFLLRKLDRVFHVRDTESADSTEVFNPQINQPVKARAFTFTPPKA